VSGSQTQGKRVTLNGGAQDVTTTSANVRASELTVRAGKTSITPAVR
jgi:filamentous hemagglutinin